jgi:AraC-like DNA-binding protein
MSTLIHTDDLPAGDRFEFWRGAVSETWVPMECHTEDEGAFWAQLRSGGLGAVTVNLMTTAPHGVRRTPRLIRRSDPDLLKVFVLLRGNCVISQDDRHAHLAPADFVLYDVRRPYWARTVGDDPRPIQALTFLFPPSLLPLPPAQLARLTAVRMTAGEGVGALTSRFLLQLARNLDHYSPAEATRLATAALQIVATRLAHELDGDHWIPPQAHRRALLARIYAFIQQRLGDPKLSPRGVAAAHHISLSYLHKLFQGEGTTVAGWIRQRRLEGCRRDLADPALLSRPVAAIAARWGFTHPGHFSRTFKDAYGLTPGDYRSSSHPTAGNVDAS